MALYQSGCKFLSSLTMTLILLVGVTEVKGQLTWVKLRNGSLGNVTSATDVPPGRRDAVMGYDVANNQLILFGGSPGPMNDTWIYSIERNEWREVNATGTWPAARYGAVGGVSGGYFYLAMGKGPHDVYYNDVWRFNLSTEVWEPLPAAYQSPVMQDDNSSHPYTPPARAFTSGGIYVTGTRLYVSMGSNDDMRTKYTFAFDVRSNLWFKEDVGCSQYDPRCPHARYLQSGVMTNREEFVFFSGCLSGEGSGGPCPSHDAWRYDGQSKTWTQLDNCPTPRLYGTMAMLPEADGKRYAVLYGGQTDAATVVQTADLAADEVSILDVESGSWSRRHASPQNNMSSVPELRLSASMATGQEGIFLFGGASLHGVHANDLWMLLGNATEADQSPSSSCPKMTTNFILIHGILMVIGFGFLLPIGAMLMRHASCLYTHVTFQILGMCCVIAGFVLGVVSVRSAHFSFTHAVIGIIAVILGVLQPVNAIFRPKEPRPEERKGAARCVWQSVHHFGGRVSILLGLINISLGVFLAVAVLPIIIAWFTWLGFLVVVWFVAEMVRCSRRQREGGSCGRPMASTLHGGQSDGIINGWEKGDGAYVNPMTESHRL